MNADNTDKKSSHEKAQKAQREKELTSSLCSFCASCAFLCLILFCSYPSNPRSSAAHLILFVLPPPLIVRLIFRATISACAKTRRKFPPRILSMSCSL